MVRPRRSLLRGLTVIALASSACAAGSEETKASSAGAGAGGASASVGATASSSSSGGGGGFDASGSGGGMAGCARGADFVYVVGFGAEGSMLYRFDPPSATFTKVGPLAGCPPGIFTQGGPYPVAMALTRDAVATVLYYDGGQQDVLFNRLWTVDTETVTCTDTGKDLTLPAGQFMGVGLAFLPDPGDPDKDVLYASVQYAMGSGMASAVGTVDLAALSIATLGPTDASVKLTGTGDGRLYGFGASSIYEYDPATIAELTKLGVTLPVQSYPGNAFVFWGGDLWVFEANDANPDTATTAALLVDQATGKTTQMATVPLYVTGAGISTCAPLEPPK